MFESKYEAKLKVLRGRKGGAKQKTFCGGSMLFKCQCPLDRSTAFLGWKKVFLQTLPTKLPWVISKWNDISFWKYVEIYFLELKTI